MLISYVHLATKNGVRVIRDCRDATRDYFLPHPLAQSLFAQGGLDYDTVNDCYCEKG